MLVKKQIITGKCAACGEQTQLDNKHQLADFIRKHPPQNQSEFKDAKNSKQKQDETETQVDVQEEIINELRAIYDSFDDEIEVFDQDHEQEFFQLFDCLKEHNLDIPTKSQASYVFFCGIFEKLNQDIIEKNAYFIKRFFEELNFSDEKKQSYLMVNIQNFLLPKINKESYKMLSTVLKFFFDEELFSDDFLINWPDEDFKKDFRKHTLYSGKQNKIFIKNTSNFIEWLMTAEVE